MRDTRLDALEWTDVGHGVFSSDTERLRRMGSQAPDGRGASVAEGLYGDVGPSADKRGGCELRADFWRGLADHLDDTRGSAFKHVNVDDYIKLRTTVNGCALYLIARTRLGEIGVRFALQGVEHVALFSHLHSRRARLDRLTKGRLLWQRSIGSASVLEVRRRAQLDDRASWPEYYLWFSQQIAVLESVFMPVLGRRPGGFGVRSSWNRQRFLDDVEKWNPWSVGAAKKILDWAPQVLPVRKWGSGARTGTLLCGVRCETDACMPIALKSSGVIAFRFADVAGTPPWHERAARLRYLDRLRRIPHLDLPDRACDQRPFVPLDVVADEAAWREFTSAMQWFADATGGHSHRRARLAGHA